MAVHIIYKQGNKRQYAAVHTISQCCIVNKLIFTWMGTQDAVGAGYGQSNKIECMNDVTQASSGSGSNSSFV